MADTNINQHISETERDKWNKNIQDLRNHENGQTGIHVPTPNGRGNYYLGSDLKWHQVPIANIT